MATQSVPDPIDEEVERILADPAIRARLEEFEERLRRGALRRIAHDEVRKRLGLTPHEAERSADDS